MAKKDKKTTKKITPLELVEDNNEDLVLSVWNTEMKEEKKKKNPKVKWTVKKEKEKKNKTPHIKEHKKDPLVTVADFLWSIKTKHLSDVLIDLMTEKEIKEFAERIEILKLLKKWVTQRVIAKKLWISVTTVSRWSKVLQTGKQSIKKYI